MQKLADISLFESLGACPQADCSVFNEDPRITKALSRARSMRTPSELRHLINSLLFSVLGGALGGGYTGLLGTAFGHPFFGTDALIGSIPGALLGLYGANAMDRLPKKGRLGRYLSSLLFGGLFGLSGATIGGEGMNMPIPGAVLGAILGNSLGHAVGDSHVNAIYDVASADDAKQVFGKDVLSPAALGKLDRIKMVQDDVDRGLLSEKAGKAMISRIWYDDEGYVPMSRISDPSWLDGNGVSDED